MEKYVSFKVSTKSSDLRDKNWFIVQCAPKQNKQTNKNPHPTLHAVIFSELPKPIKIDRLCLSIKIFYRMDANIIIKVE